MYRSPYPDEIIPKQSVFDFLFGRLSEHDSRRIALIDGASGVETTYGALVQQILALAGALAARGIGVGSVVALHCPNVPAFATVFHGILRSGATATTVNALYTAEEIETQLRDSGARTLFTVSALYPQANAAAEAVGLGPDDVIVLDGMDGHPQLRDLLTSGAPAPRVEFDPATHVAVMPYSSGTTGIPKGVQLSHTNLVANVCQVRPIIDVESSDRVLALLPFSHIYGMTVLLDVALSRRAALVTMPKFDLAEFLRIIRDHHCTYLFIAPPIAVALAKHPLVDQYDLSSVRVVFSGAAPIDDALMRAVAERLGTKVRQGYGMSEASPVTHAMPPGRDQLSRGSIGLPIANVEAKLVSVETGEEIEHPADGVSEPGELLVRGPNVMLGYLGRDDATHEVIDDDGFLHTGDIATVGAKGEFYIVDRLKELIKYKGYQVAPAELEALLLTHPEITDAAVVGAQDADGQEIPKAFVVRRDSSELDEGGVMTFVAEHVAPHKKVRAVAFIDAIPKSASGKILRKDLKGK
ncbi:AMP-binding protein [Amnibacterium flavum]|uniref:4-coumarate--CoA ligase family protein n=1 Tax=Amnibacterium flavum TaxID=2173173 RepID=A0A2V1HQA6_9MICO|nr:AMP-binding protein [Amnibacterium flavum]PVZ94796.1 4-coumarate--CoA ligase family protein [Amnibacterium flavum]